MTAVHLLLLLLLLPGRPLGHILGESWLGWGEGPDCIRGDLLFWIRDDLRTDDMLDVLLCLSRKLRIMSHRCRHGGLLLASPPQQQQAMAATMAAAGLTSWTARLRK